MRNLCVRPPDHTHPDFLAACYDAHVPPERVFLPTRSAERGNARRAVCCRLLDMGWRPGQVARLMGVTTRQVRYLRSRCPAHLQHDAWRPPAGVSRTRLGRKLRRLASGAGEDRELPFHCSSVD